MKRDALEASIGALKQREADAPFRFSSSPNAPYDQCFVVETDDDPRSIDPRALTDAESCLVWHSSLRAALLAEDAACLLPMVWLGSFVRIQMALAEHGLFARVDRDRHGSDESGTLVVSPEYVDSDLSKLLHAFATLRARGVVALPSASSSRAGGWEAALDAPRGGDSTAGAVFWEEQGHETAFDMHGRLRAPLHLYWRGSWAEIARVVGETMVLRPPDDDDDSLVVVRAKEASRSKVVSYKTRRPCCRNAASLRSPRPQRAARSPSRAAGSCPKRVHREEVDATSRSRMLIVCPLVVLQ